MLHLFGSILLLFCNTALALEKDIDIYVDITEVHAPDGSKGTSVPLNILVSDEAQRIGSLEHRLQRMAAPDVYKGKINVYDWTNIRHKKGFKQCDYTDAVSCGIKNNHWTLRTIVLVGEKYATVTMKIYDDQGRVIGSGTQTAWGKIRWKPQWKLTRVKEAGGWGGNKQTEVFEMWPPKMEELPPLIRPLHINQSRQKTYISLKSLE